MIWDAETEDVQLARHNGQLRYEQDMLEYGRHRYWSDYDRAPDEGIPEQCLIDSSVHELEESYQQWIDTICEGASRSPDWLYPLLELGARKLADITIRAIVRHWFTPSFWGHLYSDHIHTPPLAQKIATQIASDACDIIAYQRAKEDHYQDWKKQSKFIKNWTIKRCNAFAKKMQKNIKLSARQKHSFGHHMLEIAASSNIIIIRKEKVKVRKSYRTYSFVEFHPEILKELHNRHEILQNSTLVYRPMLIPPIDHTEAASGGYIHTNLRKPVVQRYKDNFFGDEKKQQKFSEPSELVLRGLNAVMKTEWSVNGEVLEVMKNLFENNTGMANLPFYSFEEFMYSAPYPIDGTKEEQAKWMQLKEESWGEWYKDEQKRGRMLVRIRLAEDLLDWEYFYHVWTLDFRGRGYTVCELLSPQSSDFDRGLIRLASRRRLTEEGEYWRKVHLANLFDQDKVSFDERVQWVDDNWDMLKRISEDPYKNTEWIDDAKKKNKSFQRLSSIFDVMKEDGCSDIPVQLDGKCNGNQHWSAIMRDQTIAHLTGVAPSDKPEDLYQFVADKTTDYCLFKADENSWLKAFSEHWNEGIHRNVTKRSTMCEAYGLTFYGIQKYIRVEGHLDWVPKENRGGAIVELARAIKAALDQTLVHSNSGKAWLKEVSDVASNNNKHLSWVTPSGFRVMHYYTKTQTRRSIAKLFNNKELNFFVRTDDPDPRSARQAIAPNYIHSLDAAHMFLTIDRMIGYDIEDFCMIHDSYGCHPNFVPVMRDLIREEFLRMHRYNCLEQFKYDVERHLGVNLPEPPSQGSFDLETVINSEYFFA